MPGFEAFPGSWWRSGSFLGSAWVTCVAKRSEDRQRFRMRSYGPQDIMVLAWAERTGKHTVWRRTFSAESRSFLFSFSFPIHPVERTPTQKLTGTRPRPGRYLPCAVPCADWRHVRSASHHRYPERQRGGCFRGRHIFVVDSLFDGRYAELSSIMGSMPLDMAPKWHDCDATDSGWRSRGQRLSFFAKINPICKEICVTCETPKLHGGVAQRGFSKYVDISTDSAHAFTGAAHSNHCTFSTEARLTGFKLHTTGVLTTSLIMLCLPLAKA